MEAQENNEKCEFQAFLSELSLEGKLGNFTANGITRMEHLQDVKEEDSTNLLNLTVFEWRRLQRKFEEWKNAKKGNNTAKTTASKPAYKTSSASEVIELPKPFQNAFNTRGGMGHIVVSK